MTVEQANATRPDGSEFSAELGQEPERAAFEAAAAARGLPLARDPEWCAMGRPESERDYYAGRTNAAWWAWQEAKAAAREENERLRAELERLRPLTICGCGDHFSAHDPGTCGNCVAAMTCLPGA